MQEMRRSLFSLLQSSGDTVFNNGKIGGFDLSNKKRKNTDESPAYDKLSVILSGSRVLPASGSD